MDPILAAILAFLATDFGTGVAATLSATILIALSTKIPQVTKWARRKIAGTRLMLTGPKEAGKSSLLKFFKAGKFADRSNVVKTTVVTRTDGVVWNDDNDQDLSIADCIDIPGELEPEDQIEEIAKYKPQTLITVVALDEADIKQWIEKFCDNLVSKLRTEESLRKNLKSFTFVLNKNDMVSSQYTQNMEQSIQAIVNQKLKAIFQDNIGRVGIISCTLFKEKGGEKQAAAVALKIALSLAHKGNLINE